MLSVIGYYKLKVNILLNAQIYPVSAPVRPILSRSLYTLTDSLLVQNNLNVLISGEEISSFKTYYF